MRQITKKTCSVWLLVDEESEQTLGVFSTEALAWAASEAFFKAYGVYAWTEEKVLDKEIF